MDDQLTAEELLIRWAHVRAQIEGIPQYTTTPYGARGLAYRNDKDIRHVIVDPEQVPDLCAAQHQRGDDLKILGPVERWAQELPEPWTVDLDDQQYLMIGQPAPATPALPEGFAIQHCGDQQSLTADVIHSPNPGHKCPSATPKQEQQVVSSAQIGILNNLAVAHNVFTSNGYQRQGFATALMHNLLAWMASNKTTTLALVSSPAGKPFYESLGMKCASLATAATYLPHRA